MSVGSIPTMFTHTLTFRKVCGIMTEREHRLLKALKYYADKNFWHIQEVAGHGDRSWHWQFRPEPEGYEGYVGYHKQEKHPVDIAEKAMRDWWLIPEDEMHEPE